MMFIIFKEINQELMVNCDSQYDENIIFIFRKCRFNLSCKYFLIKIDKAIKTKHSTGQNKLLP